MLRQFRNKIIIVLIIYSWSSLLLAVEVPLFDVFEVTLTTTNNYANPYKDVTLSATFTGPGPSTITIPGFWDGGNTWKVRIAPTIIGDWTLTNVTSNDSQLNNQAMGTVFTARTATTAEIDNNEVLRHGFIRVSKIYPHSFEHYDGTPFFFMGDTQWERAILQSDGLRTDGNQLFQKYQYLDSNSRSKKGFTVASMATFNANGNLGNEGATQPFTTPHTDEILNVGFFKAVDTRIAYMTSKNIRPMLVIGSPDGGLTKNIAWIERFTKYLVARYAAYDVIWYGVKEYEEYGNGIQQIVAYGNTIQANDPYGHPTSTHTLNDTSELNGYTWLDFHGLQKREVTSAVYNLGKPVVVSEAWYKCPELGSCAWGNFSDSELLGSKGIWVAALNGGWNAGYEYYANPRGDTDELFANMNIPSINYHTYLKNFFAETEFEKLIPHDELLITGNGELMAQENNIGVITGNEYVVYLLNGGNLTINLSNGSGTMYVKWYNPTSGAFTNGSNVTTGGNQNFSAPDNNPWVLWLSATGEKPGKVPPPIPTGLSLTVE